MIDTYTSINEVALLSISIYTYYQQAFYYRIL